VVIKLKKVVDYVEPKLSGFLLNLRRSLAHKGFAKILDISTGMPAVFANPYASRFQHISSQKIAQLRLNNYKDKEKNQEGDTWKVRLIEEEFMKRMWDVEGV